MGDSKSKIRNVEQSQELSFASPTWQEGKALTVVSFNKDGSCKLHEKNLQHILMQDDVQDRLLVVISVVGKFRQGKSFLQTFMLNHMHNESWMDDDDADLEGFEWRSSTERVTNGILMWSQAFPVDLPSGDKVAVLFMDTQGTFDRTSKLQECSLVFAISTFMSSVQIYNVKGNIGSDDLDHFKCFATYGKMVTDLATVDSDRIPPFQDLWFLIRDWQNTAEYELGAEGGDLFLKSIFNSNHNDENDGGAAKELIDECFAKTNCFLLPHPGPEVISHTFNKKLSGVGKDFKTHITDFMKEVLDPSKLIIKKFQGQPVKAKNFIEALKKYAENCKAGRIPEAKTMFDTQVEAIYAAARDAAMEVFFTKMKGTFNEDTGFYSIEEFDRYSPEYQTAAVSKYDTYSMPGKTEKIREKYLELLKAEMKKQTENMRKKHILRMNIFGFVPKVIGIVSSGVVGALGVVGAVISADALAVTVAVGGTTVLAGLVLGYVTYKITSALKNAGFRLKHRIFKTSDISS